MNAVMSHSLSKQEYARLRSGESGGGEGERGDVRVGAAECGKGCKSVRVRCLGNATTQSWCWIGEHKGGKAQGSAALWRRVVACRELRLASPWGAEVMPSGPSSSVACAHRHTGAGMGSGGGGWAAEARRQRSGGGGRAAVGRRGRTAVRDGGGRPHTELVDGEGEGEGGGVQVADGAEAVAASERWWGARVCVCTA